MILDPDAHPARARTIPRSSTARSARSSMRKICATAEVAVAFGSTARIDRDNIRQASLWALARAVAALPVRPQLVFVDGCDRIEVGCECQAVISRRRAGAVDRGRLDRRQGHARPADDAARRRASGLRLRAPHGLQRAGAFRGAANGSARPSITAARSRRSRVALMARIGRCRGSWPTRRPPQACCLSELPARLISACRRSAPPESRPHAPRRSCSLSPC